MPCLPELMSRLSFLLKNVWVRTAFSCSTAYNCSSRHSDMPLLVCRSFELTSRERQKYDRKWGTTWQGKAGNAGMKLNTGNLNRNLWSRTISQVSGKIAAENRHPPLCLYSVYFNSWIPKRQSLNLSWYVDADCSLEEMISFQHLVNFSTAKCGCVW